MRKFIRALLLGWAILWFISGLLYTFSNGTTDDKFFSRFLLAGICFGFYGVIDAIDSQNSE